MYHVVLYRQAPKSLSQVSKKQKLIAIDKHSCIIFWSANDDGGEFDNLDIFSQF